MMETPLQISTRTIDVHAHAFPPEFMKKLRESVFRTLDIRKNWEWDQSRFLAEMNRYGIGLQVLSLPHVYEYYSAEDRSLAVELCKIANAEYAEITARLPARFRMFAAVPLPDVEQARRELETSRRIPGFCGISLSTNLHERTLDDPQFAELFEYANQFGAVVFLHPLQRAFPKQWYGYRLEHLIGLPVDTTFTLARLVLGGFFDRYPKIKMIAAHVGGTIPFLAPRIERAFREGKSQHEPSHYFGKLFYDTSGPTHEAIVACVARMFGAEKIVSAPIIPSVLARKASNMSNMRSVSSKSQAWAVMN